MRNIEIQNDRPVWGNACTHCMACISACPENAVEYRHTSVGKPRYYLDENGNLKSRLPFSKKRTLFSKNDSILRISLSITYRSPGIRALASSGTASMRMKTGNCALTSPGKNRFFLKTDGILPISLSAAYKIY
jgi:ferredoxin